MMTSLSLLQMSVTSSPQSPAWALSTLLYWDMMATTAQTCNTNCCSAMILEREGMLERDDYPVLDEVPLHLGHAAWCSYHN